MQVINKLSIDWDAVRELAKSAGRAAWFAIIGIVVAYLEAEITGGGLSEQTVLIAGFIVKALDRYVHKSKNTTLKGLAPAVLQG